MKFIETYGRFGATCKMRVPSDVEKQTQLAKFRIYKAQEGLQQIAKDFIGQIIKIQNDERFTKEGQCEKIVEAAQSLPGKLKSLRELTLNVAANRLFELREQVKPKNIDDLPKIMRRAEIRAALKNLEPKQRIEIFDRAIEKGDIDLFTAFDEYRDIFDLIGSNILEAGRERLLQKIHPQLADEFCGLEGAVAELADDFRQFYQELQLVGVEYKDIELAIKSLPDISVKTEHSANKTTYFGLLRSEIKPFVINTGLAKLSPLERMREARSKENV